MFTPSLNHRISTAQTAAPSTVSNTSSPSGNSSMLGSTNQASTSEFDRNANPYQSLFRRGQGDATLTNLLNQFETLMQQIIGTEYNDDLRGTSGSDSIDGKGGNDRIRGGGGNDEIYGGAGADDIRGEDGHDFVDGGDGDDRLSGGSGNDVVWGGRGSDYLEANSGDDYVSGGAGNDVLKGNEGRDVLYAASQDDNDAPEWNSINGGSGSEDTVMFDGMGGLQAWKVGEYIAVKNRQGDVDIIKEAERFSSPDLADSDSGPGFYTKDQFLAKFGSNLSLPDDVKRALDWAKRNG